MFSNNNQEELRTACRNSIESLEIWARRLIHEKMTAEYGEDFMNAKQGEEYIVKKDIRKHVSSMKTKYPDRFQRDVDTLFLDEIVYFLCNNKWYKKLFKKALDFAYPQGNEEAREFLDRICPVRNALSHSNPISVRQAEQVICYSHDFVDGLKAYYKEMGEEKMWNVPRIVKISDSFGNCKDSIDNNDPIGYYLDVKQELHPGDRYSVEVEIDSSFSEDEYTIAWRMSSRSMKFIGKGKLINIDLTVKDVSQQQHLECWVISNKQWHRYKYFDDRVNIVFAVLPPL